MRHLLISVWKRCGFNSSAASIYDISSQCLAAIQGWLVFKGGFYLRRYSKCLVFVAHAYSAGFNRYGKASMF